MGSKLQKKGNMQVCVLVSWLILANRSQNVHLSSCQNNQSDEMQLTILSTSRDDFLSINYRINTLWRILSFSYNTSVHLLQDAEQWFVFWWNWITIGWLHFLTKLHTFQERIFNLIPPRSLTQANDKSARQ